jgi:hypothetical protein
MAFISISFGGPRSLASLPGNLPGEHRTQEMRGVGARPASNVGQDERTDTHVQFPPIRFVPQRYRS